MKLFVWLFMSGLGGITLVIVMLMHYILLIVSVENSSMTPTLEAGDRVLMIRHWPTRWLRKGQIVLIEPRCVETADSMIFAVVPYIKRIVALGGEAITFSHIRQVDYSYSFSYKSNNEQNQQVWNIPAGYLFVQGDSQQSVDSRIWGPLPLQSVLGVMLMKLPHKVSVHPLQIPSIGLPLKQAVPPFVAQTLGGETVTLDNFRGHATLFLFLSPRAIIPYTTQIAELVAVGVALVVVSAAIPEVTLTWTGNFPSSVTILVAPRMSNPFLNDYHIFGTPAFCLVNQHSNIEATGLINPNIEDWRKQINSLIGQMFTLTESSTVEQ